MTKVIGMSVIAGACVLLVFWLMSNPWDAQPRQVIKVAGSSAVYPLTAAIAKQFQQSADRVHVAVGVPRTGGDFKQFCQGETDVHGTSRPISDEEREVCAGRGVQYYELPIALDAIAIVVHPENTWAATMTLEDLRRIVDPAAHSGTRRWRDIRSEWPDVPLNLVTPTPNSGTFDSLSHTVLGQSRVRQTDGTVTEDDAVTVVAAVAADRHALGYVPYTYFNLNRKGLRAVPVGSAQNPVSPAHETMESGAYPLVRPVFIYVNYTAAKRPEVREFVHYSLHHAGPLAPHVNLAPLSARAYTLARERFQHGKMGTAYYEDAELPVGIEQVLVREPRL